MLSRCLLWVSLAAFLSVSLLIGGLTWWYCTREDGEDGVMANPNQSISQLSVVFKNLGVCGESTTALLQHCPKLHNALTSSANEACASDFPASTSPVHCVFNNLKLLGGSSRISDAEQESFVDLDLRTTTMSSEIIFTFDSGVKMPTSEQVFLSFVHPVVRRER